MRVPTRLRELAESPPVLILDRVRSRLSEAGATDGAAAMTYYGFLSLFPGLIVFVALLGLVGSYPETYESIASTLREVSPGTVVKTINSALRDALESRATAGGLLVISLLIALYSASSGVGAALRAIRAVTGAEQRGSWLRGKLAGLALVLAVMIGLLIAFSAFLIAGPLFSAIGEEAGVGEVGRTVVAFARWPLGVAALVLTATMLYREAAPPGKATRELLPGAVAASALWIVASIGFSLYVDHFSSYDATYGALGAVIVLLVWMWVGNLALLAGAAFNTELERTRK